jgi:hypothetical protein
MDCKGDAAMIADWIIEEVIDELKSDPAMPRRSFFDWAVRLANLRSGIEMLLTHEVDGHTAVKIIETIASDLEEEQDGKT